MRVIHRIALAAASATAGVVVVAGAVAPAAQASTQSFIGGFTTPPTTIASTVPGNGDVNPYGVAVVNNNQGKLVKGDVLVSNFNNSGNFQGTGTTIVQVSPNGKVSQFAQISANGLPGSCPGGIGLTTALVVLRSGWVIVGSLPTNPPDGTSVHMQAGCLLVLNNQGKVKETFSGGGINGPWDMTALDLGGVADLFVTNVLNGNVANAPNGVNVPEGTVLRLFIAIPSDGKPPQLIKTTTIGSGFDEQSSSSALVIGPTGVGLGSDGTLYVADNVNSRIAAIPNAVFRCGSAGTGRTVSSGGALNGPLGLQIAPNGNILTVNAGDGNIVETNPFSKQQVAVKTLDTSGTPPGAGALFGLAVTPGDNGVYFVDDATNTLGLLN
jgi:hypothetical protein